MKRKNRVKDLVYYGHPYDILRSVEISAYVPKTKIFEPSFGNGINLILKYITVFSSGLGIVNVIPCFGLDGYFLVNAIITNLPSKHFSKSKKELISFSINSLGTFTLILSIFKIIYTTFV